MWRICKIFVNTDLCAVSRNPKYPGLALAYLMCCVSQFWLSRDCKTDTKIKPETASVDKLERNSSAVPFFISLLWTVVPVNGEFPSPSLPTRYLKLGLFLKNKTAFMLVKLCVQSTKHKADHSVFFSYLTTWLSSFNNLFLKRMS